MGRPVSLAVTRTFVGPRLITLQCVQVGDGELPGDCRTFGANGRIGGHPGHGLLEAPGPPMGGELLQRHGDKPIQSHII